MSSLLEKKKSITTQEDVTATMVPFTPPSNVQPFASCVGTVRTSLPMTPPIRRSYASPPQILVTAIWETRRYILRNGCATVVRDTMSR
jgi:hypothetical protein